MPPPVKVVSIKLKVESYVNTWFNTRRSSARIEVLCTFSTHPTDMSLSTHRETTHTPTLSPFIYEVRERIYESTYALRYNGSIYGLTLY